MGKISSSLEFLIGISKFQTTVSRRLDSALNGISMNELIIMHYLSQTEEQKMRRIDLAERLGLTASGITRLLLPMEKIGLVKKEANDRDARVSFVKLAPGGKIKLKEGLERAEIFCEDMIGAGQSAKTKEFLKFILKIGKKI